MRPYVNFHKQQITSLNCISHKIWHNEIDLILPQFSKSRKEKQGIITLLISGFIGLISEGISSFLCNKRHKPYIKLSMQ